MLREGMVEEGDVAQVAELKRPIASELVQPIEIIDAEQLAARLKLPKSWIMEATRSRAVDPVPFLRFGRYVRFRWNSHELNAWLGRRMNGKT
jgi:hypothetical protein